MSTTCQPFRSKTAKSLPFAVCSVLWIFAAGSALAAWPSSGLPIATGPVRQWLPVGITAPGGDLQVFWSEIAASNTLRAQRVTLQGTNATGWPDGGRGVVQTPASITRPELTSDGAGGYLLAWYDYRNSGGTRGIYGVRVDDEATVMPGWSTSGTPICTTQTAAGGPLDQLMKICSDGSGGAFVAWTDSRNSPPVGGLDYDVFAQHILADGSLDPAWPAEGLQLTDGFYYEYPHALIADTSGGFWLVSEDDHNPYWINVAHHRSDGSVRGVAGIPLPASQPRAVSDGLSGVFVTWRDCRDCAGTAADDAIYVMRFGPGAQVRPGWQDGVQVSASSRDERQPSITRTNGGAVVIAWLETGGAENDEFKAQRVESNATLAEWPAGGRTFATSNDILDGWPLIVSDGDGGAMFAFRRNRPNLFGSRVTEAGTVPAAFPDTGLSLCSVTDDQFLSALVSDGLNGAYVLWEDQREGLNDVDVYAMHFTRDGELGSTTDVDSTPPVPTSGIALSVPAPNPTSGNSFLRLSLAANTRVRVEILDLSGRVVTTLLDENLPAGPTDLHWDGSDGDGRLAPPGVYLMRARAGDLEAVQRIVRLK